MQNELNNQETKKPAKDTIWLAEFDTRPRKFKIAVLLLVMTYVKISKKENLKKIAKFSSISSMKIST